MSQEDIRPYFAHRLTVQKSWDTTNPLYLTRYNQAFNEAGMWYDPQNTPYVGTARESDGWQDRESIVANAVRTNNIITAYNILTNFNAVDSTIWADTIGFVSHSSWTQMFVALFGVKYTQNSTNTYNITYDVDFNPNDSNEDRQILNRNTIIQSKGWYTTGMSADGTLTFIVSGADTSSGTDDEAFHALVEGENTATVSFSDGTTITVPSYTTLSADATINTQMGTYNNIPQNGYVVYQVTNSASTAGKTIVWMTAWEGDIQYFNNSNFSVNPSGCFWIKDLTFPISSAVVEDYLASSLEMYPNPTDSLVTVKLPDNIHINEIRVSSLDWLTLFMIPATTSNQIDLSSLASGVYLVNIETDQGTVSKKLIRQ